MLKIAKQLKEWGWDGKDLFNRLEKQVEVNKRMFYYHLKEKGDYAGTMKLVKNFYNEQKKKHKYDTEQDVLDRQKGERFIKKIQKQKGISKISKRGITHDARKYIKRKDFNNLDKMMSKFYDDEGKPVFMPTP